MMMIIMMVVKMKIITTIESAVDLNASFPPSCARLQSGVKVIHRRPCTKPLVVQGARGRREDASAMERLRLWMWLYSL